MADQGNNCARGFIDASYAGYDLVSRCALNWSRDPGYPGSLRGVNDVYGFGGDGFPAYFNGVFGAVDHAGCVEELIFSDGVERKLVCRPAGSSVSLDAVALSPDAATLYTNNWLQAGASSSTDGVMMVPIHDDPTKTPHRCANWTGTPGCPAAAPTVLVSDYRGTPIHADGIAATEQAVYVVDSKVNALYRIANGSAQRLAGGNAAAAAFTDGQGCQATLNAPHGVAALELGTTTLLFVADTGNQRIRKLVLTR